jgi:release factor glutamine methyltransferase
MESQTTITTEAKPKSLNDALLEGARRLRVAGIQSARLDAEVLLSQLLGMPKAELYLNLDGPLELADETRFRELLLRRARQEPVAYITGQKEFWSLDFCVTPDVLIPRPETELVVEVALEDAKRCRGKSQLRVLDLGTGSGVIAIALAKELPQAKMTAVEISNAAVRVARQNSERYSVENRIHFVGGDWFEYVGGTFDFIVSNPPYVRRGELSSLSAEIRGWEPLTALDGGTDGLDCYRRIIAEAHRHLVPEGAIILEIGADMGEAVADLLSRAGGYRPALLYQDYAGRDRVIAATKLPSSNFAAKGVNRG